MPDRGPVVLPVAWLTVNRSEGPSAVQSWAAGPPITVLRMEVMVTVL